MTRKPTTLEAELAAAEADLAHLAAERDLWRLARQEALHACCKANNTYIQASLAIEPLRAAVAAERARAWPAAATDTAEIRRRRAGGLPWRQKVDGLGMIVT